MFIPQPSRAIMSSRFRPHRFIRLVTSTNNHRDLTTQSKEEIKLSIVPGIFLAASTATAGFQAASFLTSLLGIPVSGIPVSILLGMAIKNSSVGYPDDSCKLGVTFSTKTILQGGIVAVAAKLSFFDLITVGSCGIPVVLASVGAGLLFIPAAGQLAGLPKDMTSLLAAGTSICGVTAITALAPAIHASNRATAVAVANTVAFGTLGMLIYPYIFHALCTSSEQVGMCLGIAIHDTSQVLGSAMSYREIYDDETVLRVAAVTKLTRNLGLAFAIPTLTYAYIVSNVVQKESVAASGKEATMSGLATFQQYVPPFLIAFIAMSTFRSCGDFYFGPEGSTVLYHQAIDFIGNDVSKCALGTAMAGVGLSTSASSLKGVGWRPFAVGGAGSLVVGGTGFAVSTLLV
jgi:uncharacterized integral membrane protein (TIGR00698 family)